MSTEYESNKSINGQEIAFARKVFIGTGVIISLILVLLFIWYMIRIVLLVFIGILVAIFFRGIGDWVSGWCGLSGRLSLTLVILFFSGLMAVGAWLLYPRIYKEVNRLEDQLPQAVQHIVDLAEKNMGLSQAREKNKVTMSVESLFKRAGTIFSLTIEALTDIVIIFFISLYLAFGSDIYIRGVLRLVPLEMRQTVSELMYTIGITLKWWLIGIFMMMIFVGTMSGIGLWLLDIPLALSLGILAGLLTFIPYFGPILSAIPAILMALLVDLSHAFYVIILYLIIHIIEGYILSPLVQRRTIYLPPILNLTAVAGMSILLGIHGLIVAIPATAVMLILVKKIYIEGILGDNAG